MVQPIALGVVAVAQPDLARRHLDPAQVLADLDRRQLAIDAVSKPGIVAAVQPPIGPVAAALAESRAVDQPDRPADVVIVNGATQVWGGDPLHHTANALTAAKGLLRAGGRLLLGEGFWEREPTDEQLAAMPVPRGQYGSLADLVDLAHMHGYRMLAVEQASLDEWDVFENGHALAWERWLRANPDSPHAEEIRAKADRARNYRLRGWRATMGLAYVTLQAP